MKPYEVYRKMELSEYENSKEWIVNRLLYLDYISVVDPLSFVMNGMHDELCLLESAAMSNMEMFNMQLNCMTFDENGQFCPKYYTLEQYYPADGKGDTYA